VWGEYQATKSCAQCNHRDPFLVSKAIEGQIVSIACGPHQTIAVTSTRSQLHNTHDMRYTHALTFVLSPGQRTTGCGRGAAEC
jgi:hypothetical protein